MIAERIRTLISLNLMNLTMMNWHVQLIRIANLIVWSNRMCADMSTTRIDRSTSCSECTVRIEYLHFYVQAILLNDRFVHTSNENGQKAITMDRFWAWLQRKSRTGTPQQIPESVQEIVLHEQVCRFIKCNWSAKGPNGDQSLPWAPLFFLMINKDKASGNTHLGVILETCWKLHSQFPKLPKLEPIGINPELPIAGCIQNASVADSLDFRSCIESCCASLICVLLIVMCCLALSCVLLIWQRVTVMCFQVR